MQGVLAPLTLRPQLGKEFLFFRDGTHRLAVDLSLFGLAEFTQGHLCSAHSNHQVEVSNHATKANTLLPPRYQGLEREKKEKPPAGKGALQLKQVSVFLAKFIIPPLVGALMVMVRVCSPSAQGKKKKWWM